MKKVGKKASNQPIRILQIGLHDQLGGIEMFVMNYYRKLNRKKIQFDFISIHQKMCFEDEISELGGKVLHIPSPKKHPIKYYKELRKIVKHGKYTAIHVHMRSAANIIPILVAKQNHIHSIGHAHYTKTPANPIKKILHFLNRPFLQKANTHFACSTKAGQWMYNDSNFTIVPNSTDIHHFKFNTEHRQEFRQKFKIPKTALVVGHIGRFSREKNQRFLIKTFQQVHSQVKNSYLVLAGTGPDLPRAQALAKKLKLEKNVIFTGQLTNPADFYCAIDIFTMPSLFEGFPMAGVEAQLTGLPCIFSNKVPDEIILDSDNSKLLPIHQKDIQTWSNEILATKKQAKYSKRKLPKNSQEYNIDSSIKKMEHFYRHIDTSEEPENKINIILDLVFIIGYICTVASEMFYTISFVQNLLPVLNVFGMACIFLYTSYHLLIQKNKQQTLVFCGLIIISVASYFMSDDTIPIKLYLLTIAVIFYSFKHCIELDFKIRTIMLITVLLCSGLNLTTNFETFARMDGSLRYTLGFAHPNAFGIYSSMIVIEKLYLDYSNNKRSIIIQNIILSTIVLVINIFVTNSRTTCILLFVTVVIYLIPKNKITKFFQHPIMKILERYSIFLFAIISLILISIGQSSSIIASKINSLLSFRPRLFAQYYDSFGFTFMGNSLPSQVSGRTPLDNTYLTIFIKYGIIHFVILSTTIIKSIIKMQTKKDYFLIYILNIILFFGIMETSAIKPGINPFILALSYAIPQNTKPEESYV